jgi:hypothetical protein
MSEAEEQWESVGEPLELARFETLEEAKIFQNELTQKYSAMATGESNLLGEMTSRKDFTAGN